MMKLRSRLLTLITTVAVAVTSLGIATTAFAANYYIDLGMNDTSAVVGESYYMDYSTDYDGSSDVRWSSSNNTVATITSDGYFEAHRRGTVRITARVSDASDSITISVTGDSGGGVEPRRIRFEDNEKTFYVDESYSLNYVIEPEDFTVNVDLTWSSSDSSVVSVDSNGNIDCHKPGTASITARVKGYSARGSISIEVRATSEWRRDNPDWSSSYYDDSRDDITSSSSRATTVSGKITAAASVSGVASRETVADAVKNAKGRATTLAGYESVSIASLKAAASAGTGNVNFDTKSGKSVMGRLVISPANAAKLGEGSIKLGVYHRDEKTKSLQEYYDSNYSNSLHVVKCAQNNYGMNVTIKVRVGTGVRASNLEFYSYNTSDKTHTKMTVSNVKIDSNGYVSFTTTRGGTIIISEGNLERA